MITPAPWPRQRQATAVHLSPHLCFCVPLLLSDRLTTDRACWAFTCPSGPALLFCFLSPPSLTLDDRLTSRRLPHVSPQATVSRLATDDHYTPRCVKRSTLGLTALPVASASLSHVLAREGSQPLNPKNYELTRVDSLFALHYPGQIDCHSDIDISTHHFDVWKT